MNYENAIKRVNADFAEKKANVENKYDKEMTAAKKQPTEALRKAAEMVAKRHREDALYDELNGIETERQKILAQLMEKQEKQKNQGM